MFFNHGYILVLDPHQDDTHGVGQLLTQLSCPVPVVVAGSLEQVIDRANQRTPSLVILMGDARTWSQELVDSIRQSVNALPEQTTIVALTDSSSPQWSHQEDNPGLDGFLVKPLSGDVLTSLVASALAKYGYGFPYH